jgi:hypothetical protein
MVVSTVVGAGVATGVAGWVHPAAKTSTQQEMSARIIVSTLFMPE